MTIALFFAILTEYAVITFEFGMVLALRTDRFFLLMWHTGVSVDAVDSPRPVMKEARTRVVSRHLVKDGT
jgi:hypothetical protein